jgi:phosphatidylinositol-3-phosphatase
MTRLAALSLLVAACGFATPATASAATPTKILVIVDENHTRAQAEAAMPYLVGLQRQYGYATDAQATSHPSLPNYLMMAFGSTYGITDDKNPVAHPISDPSVFGDALAHGRTAHVYSDAATSNCPLTNQGTYFKVRHTGWPYATSERAQCRRYDTPIGPLDGDVGAGRLPNVGWLIPSVQHDGHKPSTLQDADSWLRQQIPPILAGPDFTSGDLAVVITFDEGRDANQNVTFVVLQAGLSHLVVTDPINQHDLYLWQERLAGIDTGRSDAGSRFGL